MQCATDLLTDNSKERRIWAISPEEAMATDQPDTAPYINKYS